MTENLITGEITALAFGGEGILRHDGMVIFVPFTVPGDTISCRIVKKKKSFATGELVKIVTPSTHRTAPGCPYYGSCGGCQMQHIKYDYQTEYKKIWVEDALKRIGKVSCDHVSDTVATQDRWAYRRHVTLHIKQVGNSFIAGYYSTDNQRLIQVQQCPIFVKPEDPIITQVQTLVKKFYADQDNQGRVSILKSESNKYILHFAFEQLPINAKGACETALKELALVQGISLSANETLFNFGKTSAELVVNEMTFKYNPHVFIQNHPEQSNKIYNQILALSKKANAYRILDLYCGIGVSSILLANSGAHVVGIEGNPESIKLAKENAELNKISHADFKQGDVKKLLKEALKRHNPELILVNPPRVGMDPEVVEALMNSKVQHIIYISCMPATLARDLQKLCEENYSIVNCEPFDMFPQTAHVETLVYLQRKEK